MLFGHSSAVDSFPKQNLEKEIYKTVIVKKNMAIIGLFRKILWVFARNKFVNYTASGLTWMV
jgi:hypothetical protein